MSDQISEITDWLLQGDVAIQYQTHRDLLGTQRPDLRARIVHEGWGKRYLDHRNPDGSWGQEFYRPKWTSTHYTLLELMALCIDPHHHLINESVKNIALQYKAMDGGIGCSRKAAKSDACVNGMFLNYACYFGLQEDLLCSIVDFLLAEHMDDGGFNCQSNRSGAHHSSLHSTLSVLEGILSFQRSGYSYRLDELTNAAMLSQEFILLHRLFKSDRTGQIIDKKFLNFSHPARWHYNILRALDYLRNAGVSYDARMRDAIDVITHKRQKDGCWPKQASHTGKVFFVMEPARGPSWWNTLMALRILKAYDKHQ